MEEGEGGFGLEESEGGGWRREGEGVKGGRRRGLKEGCPEGISQRNFDHFNSAGNIAVSPRWPSDMVGRSLFLFNGMSGLCPFFALTLFLFCFII